MTLDKIKSITYGTAVYKTNKGNKLVYITQELGKDMVPYFAAGKKIIPLSKSISKLGQSAKTLFIEVTWEVFKTEKLKDESTVQP